MPEIERNNKRIEETQNSEMTVRDALYAREEKVCGLEPEIIFIAIRNLSSLFLNYFPCRFVVQPG